MHAGIQTPWCRHPRSRYPQEQTPPREQTALGADTPPGDGYCCGWYASYWNVFLFTLCKRKGESGVTSHGIIGSSGRSKISRKEEPTPKMVHQPNFCTIFAENYMKIKDFGPRYATRKLGGLFILCDSKNKNKFIVPHSPFGECDYTLTSPLHPL